MTLTVDGNAAEIVTWGEVIERRCHDNRYLAEIARPWFTIIGPARNAAYGTRGLNEMGARGVLAQVLNCYYRWEVMEEACAGWDEMLDVLRDMLGYAVLMGIVYGVNPTKVKYPYEYDVWQPSHAKLRDMWLNPIRMFPTAVEQSLELAWGMYETSDSRAPELRMV